MFGSKLKTWMENHIGRPRKKNHQEKDKGHGGQMSQGAQGGGRGLILESSESLAQSDTGISSGSQQVLSSSTTDNREGYCTTTMESDRSGIFGQTAINLSSPESAYSTGYSTDGASPGATGPPEYYINIRTGKHYFPSPAPTPTSPQPNPAFTQFHSGNQSITTAFLPINPTLPPVPTLPSQFPPPPPPSTQNPVLSATSSIKSRIVKSSQLSNGYPSVLSTFSPENVKTIPEGNEGKQTALSTSVPSHFSFGKSPCKKVPPKSPLCSLKLFLKSPKQDKVKPKPDLDKTPTFENKKKILSPIKNKKWYKQPFQKFGHRRTDSCDENNMKTDIKKDVFFDKSVYFITKDNTSSPRQRNRIKTNPWLPTEPMSSQNFQNLQINFSPSLARNRSCTNTPLQNRKTNEVDTLQNRIKQMNVKYEESRQYRNSIEKVVNRTVGHQLFLELSDHSEEDTTLNEMMGTYNESYVYEKETDILSDSDPTDCEDYVSDSEADNGGDEQDSHDDELDFIDNGSIVETDDNFAGNTGKCTYHDVYVKKNSFLFKSDRHHSRKDSESRKSFRKEAESKRRRSKEEKKRRPTRKSFKCEEDDRKKSEGKPKQESSLSLSRVLMQKMMAKNGSKSAEGTPVSVRRQKLLKELRETHIGDEKSKNGKTGLINAVLEKDIILVDIEADKKYNELIKEAENIIESMQNSPVIQNRRKVIRSESAKPAEDSIDIWRKTEKMCCPKYGVPEQGTPVRKSPKHLGLKLSVEDTPKKLKELEFGKDKKSSFKAKSSAHSPLDPLGPTFRNFTVFKPTNIDDGKITSSSSEEESKTKPWNHPEVPESKTIIPGSPIVPIAFQSVDLGKPLTSYCPQSEPVKRKIYSCSKTYDKLVKQFENKPKIFEEGKNERQTSLSKRKVQEEVEPSLNRAVKERGNQGSGRKQEDRKEVPDGFFLNGGLVYSPKLSPRRSSMPFNGASPNLSQRYSFDLDNFR